VYGVVRFGGAIAGHVFEARAGRDSAAAATAQSVVNGLWGDDLGRYARDVGIEMAVRDGNGGIVPPDRRLGSAVPRATGRIVVLVHGLVETERCWTGTDTEQGFLERLDEHPDLTPVLVRYNSGLRVSENGALLAGLLDRVHSFWPVPVESISLVGHSMGGLVIRAACSVATDGESRWIGDVDRVVTIGTPHRGAPLEKSVNAAAWALGAVPETRPLAAFLNSRSVGIKDLRFGGIAESDWRDRDPDALLRNPVGDHPLPSGIDHHFVGGVVTADPDHPFGASVGDLVVRPSSATARGQLSPTSTAVFGRTRHASLQRNPAIVEHAMAILAGD
jgi:pimeloyl-ACP methyl ester carboxylesterase